MSGKGDGRRPTDEKAYSDNYDRIFGKKSTDGQPSSEPLTEKVSEESWQTAASE